jgi:hypothetical protein
MSEPNIQLTEPLARDKTLARFNEIYLAAEDDCYCTDEQRAGVVPAGSCDVLTCEPCAARSVINSITTFKSPVK